ncbi:T9SS type A sorting domain-containing protein [Balneolales bacterium ANBcel1]|nr:T9SS type A sorting domain-containing protein [Balneolales bacterium ANBcel1]
MMRSTAIAGVLALAVSLHPCPWTGMSVAEARPATDDIRISTENSLPEDGRAGLAGGGDWSHIPRSRTFDVVTWNIEWFGDATRGPSDNELQFNNVVEIIQTMQPDLIGVQEIADQAQFDRLMDELPEYEGFITNFSQPQQTGFIFRSESVDTLFTRMLDSQMGMSFYHWAGRFPLEVAFVASVEDTDKVMMAVVIHAKAMSDEKDYNRRVAASAQIKEYFDHSIGSTPLLFLGDYNDRVTGTNAGDDLPSPYRNFVLDPYYEVVTLPVEEAGEASWPGIGSHFEASMIDHITVNRPLADSWLRGSERVYYPYYISQYHNTTSDHYPVKARFDITGKATVTSAGTGDDTPPAEHPGPARLMANYPNPFNPATSIPFRLEEPTRASLTIYSTLGQKVAQPVRDRFHPAGTHTVRFEAGSLPSGLYLYELRTDGGFRTARTMHLVK